MTDQLECYVDLVLCIDATGDMDKTIEDVKNSAKCMRTKILEAYSKADRNIAIFRIKVIAFRDYYHDGDKAMMVSDFFAMPDQINEFDSYISSICADGGGDEPESALEALAIAMKSDWNDIGARRRQFIMLWTNAPAHKLEEAYGSKIPENYPKDMPVNLTELSNIWHNKQSESGKKPDIRRLFLFAPDVYPWSTIGTEWDETIWIPLNEDIEKKLNPDYFTAW